MEQLYAGISWQNGQVEVKFSHLFFHQVRGSGSALSSGMVSCNVNSFLILCSGSSSVDADCGSFPCCFFFPPECLTKVPSDLSLLHMKEMFADFGFFVCTLSKRCCFTSFFNVIKLSLKGGVKKGNCVQYQLQVPVLISVLEIFSKFFFQLSF